MSLYMLDTNICSYIIKNTPEATRMKLKKTEKEHTVAISSIVASELLYGATKKGSPKLQKIVANFIGNFVIYDYSQVEAQIYASLRTKLEKSGRVIGANDMFIAAHAVSLDAVLVTNNTKEFERVNGLRLENWVAS